MMTNHYYNLYLQLVQEHKSLWRIKNVYKKDARGCKKCLDFWKKLEKEKEQEIEELEELISKHSSKGF